MYPSYQYGSSVPTDPRAYIAHLARMSASRSQNVNNVNVPPNIAATVAAAEAATRARNTGSTMPEADQPKSPPLMAEDSVQDGGDAIDTFSSYIPTALPQCIVNVLHEKVACESKSSTDSITSTSKSSAPQVSGQQVIELLDSDDDSLEIVHDNGKSSPSDGAKNEDTTKQIKSTNESTSNSIKSLFLNNPIQSHTSPAVESALLSSVSAPPVPDSAADVILPLVKEGKLSPLQAEGACLAVNRFRRVFKSDKGGVRAGFFIGDGAGIGKGRQISSIILDALTRNHGKGRHLWISVSRELIQDAKRDLSDIGCHVSVHDGAEVLDQMSGGKKAKGLGAGASLGKGVLFITYSLLVSGKRVEDIIAWLANTGSVMGKNVEKARERTEIEQSFSGCIVFDEAHKAKNLEQDTRTAKLVLALQERLPNARVLYCSATGVSDIKHMVYATRLGLWGEANPLYPTFDSFNSALSKRGVGAQEMLALEMKRKGIFLARTLSWDGAEFHTLEVSLNKDQIAMYDGAVRWWLNAKSEIEEATSHVGTPKILWRAYWSAHQRFFKEMCICSKVDEIVNQAKQYLEHEDYAIVIGLQSTGESGTYAALEDLAESLAANAGQKVREKIDFEDINLAGLVSTCSSIMTNFVKNHYPVALQPPEAPKVPPIPPNGFASEADRLEHARLSGLADRIRNEPPPQPIPHLVKRRDALLESILDLTLPPNPLDDLIDRLGGVDNVAEMTGRTGRILRQKNGKYRYMKRFGGSSKQKSYALSLPDEDEQDRLNIVEKRKFMEGKKSVAIISDAASISLHADRRCQSSHKRRVHFTIELPWAADKAIQQLGRTHRSGQTSAPIYKMVVTELGGERRFASAVSKRMASMGALTKGDRRAASGSDLSEFDIDSNFGKRALARVSNSLTGQPPTAPARNSYSILDKFISNDREIHADPRKSIADKRAIALSASSNALTEIGMNGDNTVKKFLNRIAGLDVARQNLIFSLFMATLDDVITEAKATGEYEGSVEDIRASSVTLKCKPQIIATDRSCAATTELTRLVLDRGVSFDQIIETMIEEYPVSHSSNCQISEEDDDDEGHCKSGFYLSKRKIAGRYLVVFARRKNEKRGSNDSGSIDPLKLMVITRPNTGRNPCEMASEEMRYKYKLLVSAKDILNYIFTNNSDTSSAEEKKSEKDVVLKYPTNEDAVSLIRERFGAVVGDLWDDAYVNSNHSNHRNGLAPRISEMGLITGAVLHVLPSLEKAVQFLSQNQKALRVMRAEIDNSFLVGIQFPLTETAIERLMAVMEAVAEARQGSLDTPSFVDDCWSPVDEKAKQWATAERKTMLSFFGTAKVPASKSSNISSGNGGVSQDLRKRKESESMSTIPSLNNVKKHKSSGATKTSKTPNIASFFKK